MTRPQRLADGRYVCQNCLRKFTKNPKATIEPKFCGDNCRKEFHTTGGMSLRKLRDYIETEVDRHVAARVPGLIDAAVEAFARRLRPAAFRKRKVHEAGRSV